MKYKSFDTYTMDEGEPVLRSCWECNGAHEHLKDTDFLHVCFSCGRYWIHGHFLDEFESQEKLDEFLKAHLTTLALDPPSALVNGKPSHTLSASKFIDPANSAGK